MKVCVVMDNGFEELEAMGPIALMRRAGLDVDLVGIDMIFPKRIVWYCREVRIGKKSKRMKKFWNS